MSLTISIDRTSLSLAPLVLSGSDDSTPLGVTGYQEPAIEPRISYVPDSAWVDGSVAVAVSYAQTFLGFDVVTDQAVSESESRLLLAELRRALGQFRYGVTVTVGDAPPETWACDPGTVGPIDRSFVDLRDHNPVWPVTIPCRPTRTIGA